MRLLKKVCPAILVAGLALSAIPASAVDFLCVTYGNVVVTYQCENTCVVEHTPGGGITVRDSQGGWVKSQLRYTTEWYCGSV